MRPFIKKEILAYVRTMRRGVTVPNEGQNETLRNCMAIYNQEDCKNDAATIGKVAHQIGRNVKTTLVILEAVCATPGLTTQPYGQRQRQHQKKEIDLTRDITYQPEKVFFATMRTKVRGSSSSSQADLRLNERAKKSPWRPGWSVYGGMLLLSYRGHKVIFWTLVGNRFSLPNQ